MVIGPNVRLSDERMGTLAPALLEAAYELADTRLDSVPKLSTMTSSN